MRIDGNKLANQWKQELRVKNQELGLKPNLLIVLMDKDENSMKYVELKKKVGKEIGIMISIHSPESPTGANTPGEYSKYDGVVIQRPKKADKKLWEDLVNQISPEKDVDGLRKDSKWEAPAVKVVRLFLDKYSNEKVKNVVIVGKGPTVGGPIIRFLKKISGVDLKICDSKTSKDELKKAVGEADLVIVGTGVAGLIKVKWLKLEAGVIDFGWGKPEVEGDLEEKTSFYTPVPGGVGPMIIMALMENVIKSCLWQKK